MGSDDPNGGLRRTLEVDVKLAGDRVAAGSNLKHVAGLEALKRPGKCGTVFLIGLFDIVLNMQRPARLDVSPTRQNASD